MDHPWQHHYFSLLAGLALVTLVFVPYYRETVFPAGFLPLQKNYRTAWLRQVAAE